MTLETTHAGMAEDRATPTYQPDANGEAKGETRSALPAGGARQAGEALLTVSELVHELRTPLHSARLALELAGDSPEASVVLRSALAHMHELLEDVAGTASTPGQSSLRVTVTEAVLLADLDGRVSVTDELPGDVQLPVAPATLRQLVVILLSNALKYSSAGSEVGLGLRSEERAVVVSVSDHGAGVPPQDRESIFVPGRRGSGVTSVEGNGLGLGIARRLAATFAGTVEIARTGPQGSCFELTIPLSGHGVEILKS
jgi:two-component system OmpR family sensor kinase